MSFIFFLILLVIILVAVVLFTVAGILRAIFSFGRKYQRSSHYQGYGNNNQSSQKTADDFRKTRKTSRIFDQQEGEYIDYEDVKD